MQLDSAIHEVLATTVVAAAALTALALLARSLGRTREGIWLVAPVVAAFVLRTLATFGISITPAERTLRGGDELLWLSNAEAASQTGIFSDISLELLVSEFHSWVISIGFRLFGEQIDPALRIVQIGIAVAGLALVAAAVYDLAGPRAGILAAWLLAFEPSSIFFSSLLHKEPPLILAAGLIALGGVRVWKRGELLGMVPMAVGCLVAVATRPYAGWFLIGAGAVIAFHGSLRHVGSRVATIPLAVLMTAAIAAAVPVVWSASEEDQLPAQLHGSQTANVGNVDSNLALERVDFSSRGAILVNLPQRVRDVLLRPYPWQVSNLSQQLGVAGGLATLAVLLMLARYAWLARGQIILRAGPFVYLGIAVLIAYSLSAGNAGTAFRYRTHILLFMIATLVVLREHVLEERRAQASQTATPSTEAPPGHPVPISA